MVHPADVRRVELVSMNRLDPDPSICDRSSLFPSRWWVHPLIVIVFLALVPWFFWGPNPLDHDALRVLNSRTAQLENIPATRVVVQPHRGMLSDPPMIKIGAYSHQCQECHQLFESPPETTRPLQQHQKIVLNHGMNDRCFNCHDREDRNRLALNGDRTIGYGDVEMLCSKCHGPTYQDWKKGIHGRNDGYWNRERGTPIHRKCTECHDPHSPAFGAWPLMPGPNSLRVHREDYERAEAIEREEAAREARHIPLRQWSPDGRMPAEGESPAHGESEEDD